MTNDLMINLLESLKADLLHSLQANGRPVSTQTAHQITVTETGDGAKLEIPGYMLLLETGRAPTGPDAVAGNPPMIQRIRQWCREKGIPDKAAWAIKKAIDKKGFKGTTGIITAALGDENINIRLNQAMEAIADETAQQVAESLNIQ